MKSSTYCSRGRFKERRGTLGFKLEYETETLKLLLGPSNSIQELIRLPLSKQLISHELATGNENGSVKLHCPAVGKRFTAEEISAQILKKLVDDASSFLNESVNKAVVTVPAYFNDSQIRATKDACRIAGLDVLRIMNEPTAASLAYGLDNKTDETVVDLGGATFDVSVLQVGDGVTEVLSTSGDNHLGGEDFDKKIMEWLAENFKLTSH